MIILFRRVFSYSNNSLDNSRVEFEFFRIGVEFRFANYYYHQCNYSLNLLGLYDTRYNIVTMRSIVRYNVL